LPAVVWMSPGPLSALRSLMGSRRCSLTIVRLA